LLDCNRSATDVPEEGSFPYQRLFFVCFNAAHCHCSMASEA